MRGYPNQWFQNTGGTSMGGSPPPKKKTQQGKIEVKFLTGDKTCSFLYLWKSIQTHHVHPGASGHCGLQILHPPSGRFPSFETRAIEWRQEQTALIWYAGLNAALAVTCRVSLSNSGSESSGIKTPTKYRFRCQIECLSNCQNFASLMHTLTKGNMAEASCLKAIKAFQNKGLSN